MSKDIKHLLSGIIAISVMWLPGAAFAQSDDFDFDEEFEDEVVTTGQRQAPTPTSHIVPEVSFGAGDVASLGAADIGEVIEAINAEIGDQASGPPIILLDGRPVQSRREIRRFPSEAIRRVDVLPPDASLKYSSSPDRRVLNFVLRRRFNVLTSDARAQTTTDGGRHAGRLGANYLRIRNKTRLAVSLDLKASEALSEDQRDITARIRNAPFATDGNITAQPVGGEIDPSFSMLASGTVTVIGVPENAAAGALNFSDYLSGANIPALTNAQSFRDLEPKSEAINFGASLFRPVGERLSVKAALNADITKSTSQRGLIQTRFDIPSSNPFSPFSNDISLYRSSGPSLRIREESDIDATLSLFADYPTWRWAVDAEYAEASDKRETARSIDTDDLQAQINSGDPDLNPFGVSRLSSAAVSDLTLNTALIKARVNGRVADLLTGPINGSAGLEVSKVTLEALSSLSGAASENRLSRETAEIRADMDIPLAGQAGLSGGGPRGTAAQAAGRVSARLSGSLKQVQDVGTLASYGGGLNWKPAQWLQLQGSLDIREGAPSLRFLGDPLLADPNVRVTDFATGNSVFVERLSGGNPLLEPERSRHTQFTATVTHSRDLRFSSRYRSRRIENDTRSFPFLTPQISDIFSDRLNRDVNGDLIQFDARPVNAFLTQRDTLRSGFNWTKRFRRSQTGGRPSGGEPTSSGERAPRQRGRGRMRGRSDSLSVSFYHTLRLTDDIQFRENGPTLDLLDGAALSRRGGQPRHEVEARVNFRSKNYGAGLFLTHESGKILETLPLTGSSALGDLRFKPLTKADLRFYYDLGRTSQGRRVRRDSWRSNLRVTLDVNNIANQRPIVEIGSGSLPLTYEADALDPEGRVVKLSVKKMFSMRRLVK